MAKTPQPIRKASDLPGNFRSTITERLAALMRSRILAGELAAGVPLREEDLAREFDVSRHVIREVIRLLHSEGLADYSSFKGARVKKVTAAEVREIYQTRKFLEHAALALPATAVDEARVAEIQRSFVDAVKERAWLRAFELDVDFHGIIVGLAGSPQISAWHRRLCEGLRLAHLVCPAFQESGLPASVEEHAEIARALIAGDFRGAANALERHLDNAEKELTQKMTE